jgi:transposase
VKKLKILITGIGLTGKSTFRRTLKNMLSETGIIVKDIDGDYENLPERFEEKTLYLIEDVHGPTEEACLSLDNYDLIIYLLPTFLSHLIFWFKRMWVWFQEGKGGWDKKRQNWLGSGKRYDLLNIPLFLRLLLHNLRNRRKWIAQDRKVLSQFENLIVVRSQWTKGGGIKFNHVHRF